MIYRRKTKKKVVSKKRASAVVSASKKRARVKGAGDYKLYDDNGQMIRTPFATVGRDIGKFVFGERGGDIGWGVGHTLGRVIGSGDYKSPDLSYNVLVNTTTVPEFSTTQQTHIVTHREYIQDITTAATANTFKVESFPLNPGQSTTFPWLSQLAQNYEQYRIHGMIFEFVTTSADALNSVNTALGTVIMATDYNSAATTYANKQQMENSQYANSAKPSKSQMHGIECASMYTPLSHLFVRPNDLPAGQDPRWYDLGNFQLATTGFQGTNVVIGELWVTYVVEFFKPQIPSTPGGYTLTRHLYRTGCNTANPFGTVSSIAVGGLSLGISGQTVTLNSVDPGAQFLVSCIWQGGSLTNSLSIPTPGNNTGLKQYFSNDTSTGAATGVGIAGSSACTLHFIVYNASAVPAPISFTLTGATVNPSLDLFVCQMDSTITA